MGMIFDTSIWIGLSEEQITEEAASEAAGEERVFLSVISLGELSFGVESAGDLAIRMHRRRALSTFEEMPVLDVTAQTANAFGMLAAFMKQSGRSPRTRVNDLWIAAQAIENDYALLTTNIKDFEGLPGLRVVGVVS
jgi:predicted nucleic acid-binding protein